MRGGAFFNGKEGRVDFRKNLRFKEALVGFRKTSLALREVFRKPFSSLIYKKNKAYFLIVSKKYQNLIRNPT